MLSSYQMLFCDRILFIIFLHFGDDVGNCVLVMLVMASLVLLVIGG